jgi:hypothetical protein
MSKIKEKIVAFPDGRKVRRYIPYPGPVTDDTLRCIGCGQIDEDGWHNMATCIAITSGKAIYEDDKIYIPIDDGARDGERQLVKRGPNYAAGQWTGDFWSYPFGPRGDGTIGAVQIDFEPTHYWPKPFMPFEHLKGEDGDA